MTNLWRGQTLWSPWKCTTSDRIPIDKITLAHGCCTEHTNQTPDRITIICTEKVIEKKSLQKIQAKCQTNTRTNLPILAIFFSWIKYHFQRIKTEVKEYGIVARLIALNVRIACRIFYMIRIEFQCNISDGSKPIE